MALPKQTLFGQTESEVFFLANLINFGEEFLDIL